MIIKALILFSAFAQAQDIRITSWTFLDRSNLNDRAAEVCFQLQPAPEALTPIKIVTDYKTNRKGIYFAQVDHEGHACSVVASYTGHVMIMVPNQSEEEPSVKAFANRD